MNKNIDSNALFEALKKNGGDLLDRLRFNASDLMKQNSIDKSQHDKMLSMHMNKIEQKLFSFIDKYLKGIQREITKPIVNHSNKTREFSFWINKQNFLIVDNTLFVNGSLEEHLNVWIVK